MKKALIILMAIAMVFAMTSLALAKGDITAKTFSLGSKSQNDNTQIFTGQYANGEPTSTAGINGVNYSYPTEPTSTHPYGTWNSPYTLGIDGYNYNDSQDYTTDMMTNYYNTFAPGTALGNAINNTSTAYFGTGTDQAINQAGYNAFGTSGPHGGYLTSTHKCRECHAVHRAAGKFKLMRSNTRFEACDWCHGTGAGSGFNIETDNNDNYTTENNVGHTMGYGIESGKWKAPDDTYPAFTPSYWLGGFSCFDCHSPHANKSRMLGFNTKGTGGYLNAGFFIADPGNSGLQNAPDETNVRWLWSQLPPITTPDPQAATDGSSADGGDMAGAMGYFFWRLGYQPVDKNPSPTQSEIVTGATNVANMMRNLGMRLYPYGDPNYYLTADPTDFKSETDVTMMNVFGAYQAGRLYMQPGHAPLFFPVTYDSLYSFFKWSQKKPLYLPGSWLLLKDPNQKLNQELTTETVTYLDNGKWNIDFGGDSNFSFSTGSYNVSWLFGNPTAVTTDIAVGQEISDKIAWNPLNHGQTTSGNILGSQSDNQKPYDTNTDNVNNDYGTFPFLGGNKYPVTKDQNDWNWPVGMGQPGRDSQDGAHAPLLQFYSVNQFCEDCHQGNAGSSEVPAPLFSEDRALRDQGSNTATNTADSTSYNWKGNYDIAYGHDANPRH